MQTLDRIQIDSQPEFADILRLETPFAESAPAERGWADSINARFDRLVMQSGARAQASVILRLCILTGIAVGGTLFLIEENVLATAAGLVGGGLLPIAALVVARARRRRQLIQQMPPFLDAVAVAAAGGSSAIGCLESAIAVTPSPLREDVAAALRRLHMGLSVDESLEELPVRTGLPSMGAMCAALTMHDRSGGDLASLLERLASRARGDLSGRRRAVSLALLQRCAVIFLSALPTLILTVFVMRDADYLVKLTDARESLWATAAAFGFNAVGSWGLIRTLKNPWAKLA